jgi:hypothetical protein
MTPEQLAAVVAVVVGIFTAVGGAAWKAIQWQSAQVDKVRKEAEDNASAREASLMSWMEKRDRQWQEFLENQRANDLKIVADLARSVDCVTSGFSRLESKIDVHHAVVLQAIPPGQGLAGGSHAPQKRGGM